MQILRGIDSQLVTCTAHIPHSMLPSANRLQCPTNLQPTQRPMAAVCSDIQHNLSAAAAAAAAAAKLHTARHTQVCTQVCTQHNTMIQACCLHTAASLLRCAALAEASTAAVLSACTAACNQLTTQEPGVLRHNCLPQHRTAQYAPASIQTLSLHTPHFAYHNPNKPPLIYPVKTTPELLQPRRICRVAQSCTHHTLAGASALEDHSTASCCCCCVQAAAAVVGSERWCSEQPP
jgi:hypothetical protein